MLKKLIVVIAIALPFIGNASQNKIPYSLKCVGPYSLTTSENFRVDLVVETEEGTTELKTRLTGPAAVANEPIRYLVEGVELAENGFTASGINVKEQPTTDSFVSFSLRYDNQKKRMYFTPTAERVDPKTGTTERQVLAPFRLQCEETNIF